MGIPRPPVSGLPSRYTDRDSEIGYSGRADSIYNERADGGVRSVARRVSCDDRHWCNRQYWKQHGSTGPRLPQERLVNMTRTGFIVLAAVALSVFSFATDCQAQRPSSRAGTVGRPRVNPYTELYRSGYGGYRGGAYGLGGYGYGGYGSYGAAYDPILAPYLRRSQTSASRIRQPNQPGGSPTGTTNASVQRMLATRAAQAGVQGAGPRTGVAPTGTGSVFMQYSHFYQPQNFSGANTRRR